MIPQIGMMVKYQLSLDDAKVVNKRRKDANRNMAEHQNVADGSMVHVGNEVHEGDTHPMLIVRCWGETEESLVNGQVFLDGNDTLWVTSVAQGSDPRQWKDTNL